MYLVYRNNRKQFKGRTFETYERARQAIRKHIRKSYYPVQYEVFSNGMWNDISRSPTAYGGLGFEVRRVAQ